MSLNQAGIVVSCLLIVLAALFWIPWRKIHRKFPQNDGLPDPDRSTLRQPIVDPDWEVSKPRVRFISSSFQVAALERARVCKLNAPARRVTPNELKADLDKLWEGQEGNV